MKDYSYEEKREYHFARRKRLEEKMDRQHGLLTAAEFKQLMDSIGFLVGADFESCLEKKEFRSGVMRGQKAYKFNKKGKR